MHAYTVITILPIIRCILSNTITSGSLSVVCVSLYCGFPFHLPIVTDKSYQGTQSNAYENVDNCYKREETYSHLQHNTSSRSSHSLIHDNEYLDPVILNSWGEVW